MVAKEIGFQVIALLVSSPGGQGVVNTSQQGLCVSLAFIGFI